MKICLLSHEFAPFPGGGIATYHNAVASHLAAAGHEVHVVTNRAAWGSTAARDTEAMWREGNLTIHRVRCFDEKRQPPPDARFFDVNPRDYERPHRLWALHAANIAAHRAANYIEMLHDEVGLDVIESPEFFAEALYVIRRRRSGDRHRFPPVCIHGHTSSRIAFTTNEHTWELGYRPHRHLMLHEEYCIRHADALITPSHSLMQRYEQQFDDTLPALRAVIPYHVELPEAVDELPAPLRDGRAYLLCTGRIEPRKGSDLVLRAFAELAPRRPDLRLVFLGKEMWHVGERFADVLRSIVPDAYRDRVLRLGNVPRAHALAAARAAAAFVHAAPWDNYPCAVLEAMSVGGLCVVSDHGGHAEMVEDAVSGAVFARGDAGALSRALENVLDDRALADRLRAGAVQRAQAITDPTRLTAAKLDLFQKVVAAETEKPTFAAQFDLPARFHPERTPPAVPGAGALILDAIGADDAALAAGAASIQQELTGSDWTRWVLVPADGSVDAPPGFTPFTVHDPLPWLALDDDTPVLWAMAGTAFDTGGLLRVAQQVLEDGPACASFPWLRPATAKVFPYRPDFGAEDLLVAGQPAPPAFCARAAALARCRHLAGLLEPTHRICALAAAACAHGDLAVRHVGSVCGDFYGPMPVVDEEAQTRIAGYLESLGMLNAHIAVLGNTAVAVTVPPPAEEPPPPAPTEPTIDADRLAELERVFAEHNALKQMRLVRLLRRAHAFDIARRLFPKAKRAIGNG